jgi:DNA-binding NarL/FixJ family response regulator
MRGSERPQAKDAQRHTQRQVAGACPDAPAGAALPYGLSERELAVLRLLTEGLADKQIAVALGVTSYTINKHVGAILLKLNVRSRTAAAVFAIRQHLVDDDTIDGR